MARGECPVCLERYDAGKHAPMVSVACGHSVCADCADRLIPSNHPSKSDRKLRNNSSSHNPVPGQVKRRHLHRPSQRSPHSPRRTHQQVSHTVPDHVLPDTHDLDDELDVVHIVDDEEDLDDVHVASTSRREHGTAIPPKLPPILSSTQNSHQHHIAAAGQTSSPPHINDDDDFAADAVVIDDEDDDEYDDDDDDDELYEEDEDDEEDDDADTFPSSTSPNGRNNRLRRRRTPKCPSCNIPLTGFVKNFEALHVLQSVAAGSVISAQPSDNGREVLLRDESSHSKHNRKLGTIHTAVSAVSSTQDTGNFVQSYVPGREPTLGTHPSSATSYEHLQLLDGQPNVTDHYPATRLQSARPSLADVTAADNIIERKNIHFSRTPGNELGTGSTGVVYRGVYESRDVAVKCVRSAANTVRSRENFRRELKLISRLRNPHIVDFVGAAWDDEYDDINSVQPSLLLVTELMAGGTLRTALSSLPSGNGEGLEIKSFLNIATQIARGLVYLHAEGLAHRDIKSANILLSETLLPGSRSFSDQIRAKIADFGLSKYIDKVTGGAGYQQSIMEPGRLEATYAYLAPEGFGGDKTNVLRPDEDDDGRFQETAKKRDIYALGVLFWEMLTGLVPWSGVSLPDVYVRVCVRSDRPTPRLEETRVPSSLRRLVDRCWTQDARKRPSASSIVDKLERISSRMEKTNVGPDTSGPEAQGSTRHESSLPPGEVIRNGSEYGHHTIGSPVFDGSTVQQRGTMFQTSNKTQSLMGHHAHGVAGALSNVPSSKSSLTQAHRSPSDFHHVRPDQGQAHLRSEEATHFSRPKLSTSRDETQNELDESRPLEGPESGPNSRTRNKRSSVRNRAPLRSSRDPNDRTNAHSRNENEHQVGSNITVSGFSNTRDMDLSAAHYGRVGGAVRAVSSSNLGADIGSTHGHAVNGSSVNAKSARAVDPPNHNRDVSPSENVGTSAASATRRHDVDRSGRATDSINSGRLPRLQAGFESFERSPSYGGPSTTSAALSFDQSPVSLGARVVSFSGKPQVPVLRRMVSTDGSQHASEIVDGAVADVPGVHSTPQGVEDLHLQIQKMSTGDVLTMLSQQSQPPRLAALALHSLQSEKHNGNEEILRNAAALLHRLTQPPGTAGSEKKEVSAKEQLAIRKYLKANGAVASLLGILQAAQSRHATTLSYALLAIGNIIAWDLDAHKQFREADGVSRVAFCMSSFPANLGVQEKGCYALACAAGTYSSKTRIVFLQSKCIDLVVAALKEASAKSASDAVVKQACAALGAMCLGSPENSARAGHIGGVALLMSVYESLRQSSRLEGGKREEIFLVCNAFISLMVNSENRKTAAGMGGTPVLLRGMRTFRLNADFIEKCVVSLSDFCSIRSNALQAVQLNGIEDVIAAMVRFKTSVPVQHAGCRTLSLLIRATGDNGRRRLVQAGGAEAIVFAMERFGSSNGVDAGIAIEGCTAIAALASMESTMEGEILLRRLKKLRTDRSVKQVMQAHKGNAFVQDRGKEALKMMNGLKTGGGWFSRMRQRSRG